MVVVVDDVNVDVVIVEVGGKVNESQQNNHSLILTVINVFISHAFTGSFEAHRPYAQAVLTALFWNQCS